MVEELETSKKRKKNDPPIDRNTLVVRIPDDMLYKLYKRKLKENIYRNRGYILDGYPRSNADAQGIFYNLDETKPEDSLDRLVINKEIMPNNLIKFDQVNDEFLKARVKNMSEALLLNSHYNEEGMNRRLLAYKNWNESPKGDPNVTEFFSGNNVELLDLDAKLTDAELLERIKIFLDRVYLKKNF
jgi:adenylate kinase family enzyme